jgi:hypothetical protein
VLGDGSPRQILARVVDGDPLALRPRCELRVRSQAILLDVHRLHLRSAAHVARHGAAYAGAPTLDIWLAEKIRAATRELLQDEAEQVASGAIPEPPEDERLLLIAETFGIDPAVLGPGCVAFNRARYEVRAAFQGLILEAQDAEAWCAANSTTRERAKASLRSALWALGVRETPDLDGWLRGGDDE